MTSRRRTAEVSLGLDFGSTGLRAAFALPEQPVQHLRPPSGRWPWLLCEPAETGVLPVAFPSLKSRLGSGWPVRVGSTRTTPEEAVTGMLRELREQVEEDTRAAVDQTVISVPVHFQSAQRAALRDAAQAAGLAEVRLISDSVAAVIGHMAGRGSGTYLVYGMGYSGFELGLVRGARGHYRALGYEGAGTSGGRAFDEAVLSAGVRLLRRHGGASGLNGLVESAWQRLRARAQAVREQLGTAGGGAAAVLELGLGSAPALLVEFRRSAVDTFLERHVARTLRRAHSVLEQSGMTPSDVDTLLLVGGSTRMAQIRSGVAGLGRRCVEAPPELLALGAMMHAARIGRSGASGPEEGVMAPAYPSEDTLADAPPLTATVLDSPAPAPPSPASGDVAQARRLAEQGRDQEAAALLHQIIAEARKLLDEIAAGAAAPQGGAAPGQLTRSRQLLDLGRYDLAVQASHAAWRDARDQPTGAAVLDAMIDVHCEAAMADSDPDRFAAAEHWLMCAYGHDPTNVRVRGLLAERTFRHAVELHRRGQRGDAVEALEKCLAWDPEHPAAEALLRRLNRNRRNRPAAGDVPG